MKFTLALFLASAAIVSAVPVPGDVGRRAIDLGSCADASITFAIGLDGRSGTIFPTQQKVKKTCMC